MKKDSIGAGMGPGGAGQYGRGVSRAQAMQNKSALTYRTVSPVRSAAAKKGYQTRIAREAARERARLKAARSAGVKATMKKTAPIASAAVALTYGAGRITGRKEIVEAKRVASARVAKKPVKSKTGSAQAKAYNKTLKKVKGDATKIPGFTMGRNTY
jgi:hypothetical protein